MQMQSMEWPRLLSHKRLKGKIQPVDPARSPFQQDFDRIVFSTAFRRLQDKTQVFPLADNDFVHTRLTHSLETSCVGRSLGTAVGHALLERGRELAGLPASDIGAIVAAACLAHDIGNPPFGHSGEDAIRHWFLTSPIIEKMPTLYKDHWLTSPQRRDIEEYEGNAQGFRLLTRLQMATDRGGLRLTCATIGAFTKYPFPSPALKTAPWAKKIGYFESEADLFAEVADETGLLRQNNGWSRHPLVFLVEAADDICYRIIDFEDGFRLGCVSYETVCDLFQKVIGKNDPVSPDKTSEEKKNHLEVLRAQAINATVDQVRDAFLKNEEAILAGTFNQPLIECRSAGSSDALQEIRTISFKQVYGARRVIEIETAGFEVLGGLLDIFAQAVLTTKPTTRDDKVQELILDQLPKTHGPHLPYQQLLRILDFVSGMTDSYAVGLYKKLKGISLPGQ